MSFLVSTLLKQYIDACYSPSPVVITCVCHQTEDISFIKRLGLLMVQSFSIYFIPKIGDTMNQARSLSSSLSVYASASSEISCVEPTRHISFGISFNLCKLLAMAEIWRPYSFGIPGVKIILWGVKTVKKFEYCLCSS